MIMKKLIKFLFGSVIFQALVLAIVIRSFIFQPFSIPSGSMKPTLLVGDYVFVTKWTYGFSRHSLPFGHLLPFLSDRILSAEPHRGDVVVFKYPLDPSTHYIKRLVGLPGDKVRLKDSVLYINGESQERFKSGEFTGLINGRALSVPQYSEGLGDGVQYHTLDIHPNSSGDTTKTFTVPLNHYFFLGDNRDNSADSRYDVGMVESGLLVGKAQLIFLSIDNAPAWQIWNWPQSMRWDRLFTKL